MIFKDGQWFYVDLDRTKCYVRLTQIGSKYYLLYVSFKTGHISSDGSEGIESSLEDGISYEDLCKYDGRIRRYFHPIKFEEIER